MEGNPATLRQKKHHFYISCTVNPPCPITCYGRFYADLEIDTDLHQGKAFSGKWRVHIIA